MSTPITSKTLPIDSVTGLVRRLDVWMLSIDAQSERVTVQYEIVQLAPNGVVIPGTKETKHYIRFNSKKGSLFGKMITKDNLKFDQLRASEVGQMIAGMIAMDIETYDGTDTSLNQIEYTDIEDAEQS